MGGQNHRGSGDGSLKLKNFLSSYKQILHMHVETHKQVVKVKSTMLHKRVYAGAHSLF